MRFKNDWLPYDLAGRANVCRNIRSKIDKHRDQLGLSVAQTDRIKEVCNGFIYAYEITANAELSAKALVSWRRMIMDDRRKIGQPAPITPPFVIPSPPAGLTCGLVAELRRFVALIKATNGYTSAVGADLEILPPSPSQLNPDELSPKLKIEVRNGKELTIRAVMMTMDAMRVEYKPGGTDEKWRHLAFLTTLPATVPVDLPDGVMAETGSVRAIFIKKNRETGRWSPSVPVTLSR